MAQCDSLTLPIPSLSLPSARSKSSQPRTRKHLHTQSAVQTKSRTLTNELGTTSFPSTRKPRPKQPHNPHSHSKPPSFGPSKSFESKQRTDKKKVHQYQPIFGAKTEQNAQKKHDKREHKRRGSGLGVFYWTTNGKFLGKSEQKYNQ
eukprot:971704_1